MDDDVADLVIDELRNFFLSITTPFLDGLTEEDKYNARSWTQRVMQLNNYPLMKNYLILLSYMIFSGRIVSPFDVDPQRCKLPKISSTLQEQNLFAYVQREIERRNQEDILEATESALSRDEMAFLAQLPAPKGGFRLYLATSSVPYPQWSKADKFPTPTKYDIPAKEFTIEGLDLVKKKFEGSEVRHVDSEKPDDSAVGSSDRASRIDDIDEMRCHDLAVPPDETRVSSRRNDSSAYEYDSLLNSPATREPRVQIVGLKKPEVYKCAIDIPPDHKAIIEEIADLAVDDLPDAPPKLITDEDFQKEQNVLQKASRWFGDPMYSRYMETIKKLLRRKIPVDAIRRSIHRCMRQRYKPGTNIPNWLRDSLDEAEPWHTRIAHLKMRLSDVLKNEYGVTDEDELFHLSNTPAFSELNECKARELIRRAEEGRIHPAMKSKFIVEENRSCKRLMNIIDEILNSDYDPEAPPADPAASPQSGAEAKPWRCTLETAHSVSRKSYEASQQLRRHGSESSHLSSQQDSSHGAEDCSHPNECCPSGFKLESRCRQNSHPSDQQREPTQDFEFSNASKLEDFNIEDERPDELFAKLPPDSSTEDASLSRSRRSNRSSKKNSK